VKNVSITLEKEWFNFQFLKIRIILKKVLESNYNTYIIEILLLLIYSYRLCWPLIFCFLNKTQDKLNDCQIEDIALFFFLCSEYPYILIWCCLYINFPSPSNVNKFFLITRYRKTRTSCGLDLRYDLWWQFFDLLSAISNERGKWNFRREIASRKNVS